MRTSDAGSACRPGAKLPDQEPGRTTKERTVFEFRRSQPFAADGDLADLLVRVCQRRQIDVAALRSRSLRRSITDARRLAIVAGHLFVRWPLGESAQALGVSSPTASCLVAGLHRVRDEGMALGAEVRAAAEL